MNTYKDQIQHLFSLSRGLSNATLKNMQQMSRLLNHPEKKFPIIHVTGTNGKGSVCWKIAKALEYSGLRCGLFTSPHISCFRERIRIGDDWIQEEDVVRLLSKIRKVAGQASLSLTYFEYCTLLAFEYFAEKNVDAAVIEVGIGGRLDATNIATPELSIITSVGLDHTEILGPTEELIAIEKGGIIKPKIPVLIGPRVPTSPIQKIAQALDSPLTIVPERNLPYNLENSSIAKEALHLLSDRFVLNNAVIDRALAIEPPCRFERTFLKEAEILLDVAHNIQGFERLIQRLRFEYPDRAYHFMITLCRGKDVAKCAALIGPIAKSIRIPRISHPRLPPPETLLPHFANFELPVLIDDPKFLLNSLQKGELLVICGSFFMMNPIRQILGYPEPTDSP